MKKQILPIFVVLVITSCSPKLYKQITTIASEDVRLFEDGTYACIKPELSVSYNFWRSNGSVDFVVSNNTDDDILLDLSKSFFVFNGNAYDYYLSRNFVNTRVSSNTFGRAYGESRSLSYGLGASMNAQFSGLTYHNIPGSVGASASASGSVSATAAESNTFSKGFSIEYNEKPIVCIPAHTSKLFGEYRLPDEVYRECGFIRDPKPKETAVLEFDNFSSPIRFENRLSFLINGVERRVVNNFYVEKIENVNAEKVTTWVDVTSCSGHRESVNVNTASAANRYSVDYYVNGDNDRTRTPAENDKFDSGWVPLYKR